MSKIFGQNIDFNKNESLNFRFGNLMGFPSLGAGDAGYSFFHSGNAKFYGWDGTGWTELGLGGAGDADGVISNVALSGSDLVFTGAGGGFNGSVPLSSFGDGGVVDDTAYGSSWNGDTVAAPSRNSVYDEIELLRGTYVDTTTNQTVSGNKTVTGLTNFTGFQTSISNILHVYGSSSSIYLSPSSISKNSYVSGSVKMWADSDNNFSWNKSTQVANQWGYTFETQNTERRNYMFPDKSGTIAMTSDLFNTFADGDYGDIIVSSSGSVIMVDPTTVMGLNNIQTVSATKIFTDRLILGSRTGGLTNHIAFENGIDFFSGSMNPNYSFFGFEGNKMVWRSGLNSGGARMDENNTQVRDYILPDKDGTFVMMDDISQLSDGVSGTFTAGSNTITVTDGIITNIA